MSEKRYGTPGTFVWHDLMTSDLGKARKYYTDLLGWKIQEVDMGDAEPYPMILAGGQAQGGLLQLPDAAEISSHWMAYLYVDKVDATTAKVADLGGKVAREPQDIPNVGRYSVVVDPHGAFLSLFQGGDPKEELPEEPFRGAFCWDQLLTPTPEASTDFYHQLVGWQVEEVDMEEMGVYRLLKTGDAERAGVMQMPPGAQGPSAWLAYVLVDDVDATAEKVQELGGSVFVAPSDIPDVGRFTVTADPTGAVIAFMTASE